MKEKDRQFLFLDFDGVLHPFHHPYGFFSHLSLFENVINNVDLHIVISSAWRLHHTLPFIKSFFSPTVASRIIGVTPDFDDNKKLHVRQLEIEHWLKKNKTTPQEKTNWIALDDSLQLFNPDCPNLIYVNPDLGFNEDTHNQLVARLHYD